MTSPTILLFSLSLLAQITGEQPARPGGSNTAVETERADQQEQARELYRKGKASFGIGQYGAAISLFQESLRLIEDPVIRGRLMLNISAAHLRLFDKGGDVQDLENAKAIYEAYLVRADAGAPYPPEDIAETRAEVARLERELRVYYRGRGDRAEQREPTAVTPTTTPPQEPPPQTTATQSGPVGSAAADDTPPKWRAVTLLAGGSAVTAGGLVMVIVGSTYKGQAERRVEQHTGGDPLHPSAADGQEFIDLVAKRGKIMMGLGASLAAVGVGAGVLGVLQLRKNKQETLAVTPVVAPGVGGLVLVGNF